MCSCHDESYAYLPPMTVGGPSGSYFIECPTQSCRWAEFSLITMSANDIATFVVSGDSPQSAVDTTGAVTLNGDTYSPSIIGSSITGGQCVTYDPLSYYRISNSQKRVFITIVVTTGKSAYVSLRFRVKLITMVPGPAPAEHADSFHQINLRREETTRQRLATAGIPGYALDPQVK
jgi:hypothetical protein